MVWSPDGSTLVTSGFELDAWDAASGDHLFTEFPRVEIVDSEFSPNGELLAGGGSRGRRVWDFYRNGMRERLALPSDAANICCVTFRPDGDRLAVGNGGYGGRDGHRRQDLGRVGDRRGERLMLFAEGPVAWSPSDDVIAYGRDGPSIHRRTARRVVRPTRSARSARAGTRPSRPTGRRIAWSSFSRCRHRRRGDGAEGVPDGHADGVWDVDFSPDGERVATVSEDHTARVWNARTGRPELMIRLAAVGRDVAFSPDGSMLAIAEADIDGSAIRLWNASTGQEIRTLIRPARSPTRSFSPMAASSPVGWGTAPSTCGGRRARSSRGRAGWGDPVVGLRPGRVAHRDRVARSFGRGLERADGRADPHAGGSYGGSVERCVQPRRQVRDLLRRRLDGLVSGSSASTSSSTSLGLGSREP